MSQQRLSAWQGCTYQDGTATSGSIECYAFIPNEDTVVATLTGTSQGNTAFNYLTSIGITGKTLKQGTLIICPIGEKFTTITLTSGSIVRYK